MSKDPFGGRVSKEAAYKYREVFKTEPGEKVLLDLLQRFHFLASTFTPHKGETVNDVIFKEGQRSVILHIFASAEVDPNNLMSMIRKEIHSGR